MLNRLGDLMVLYMCFSMQARYISEEVKDKSNRVINTSLWHEELVDIPLQRNGYVLLIVMMILSF